MRIHHLDCVATCPLGGWLMHHRTRGIGLDDFPWAAVHLLERERDGAPHVERLAGRSAALPPQFLRTFTSEKEMNHVGFQG